MTDTLHDQVRAGVRAMLRLAGDDPDRPGLKRTPDRFLNAWIEMTTSQVDPASLLGTMFTENGGIDQMITVGPMQFSSMCEHHLLPFSGVAWIAYIPQGSVIGLSKIPRLLDHYARRPQVQERLTQDITHTLNRYLPSALGSACCIRAIHSCAELRGVRKVSPMTTTSLTGQFRDDLGAREEFLAFTRSGS